MAFDYKKEYREFYLPKKKPELITVPPMNFAAVRGKGDPNEEGLCVQCMHVGSYDDEPATVGAMDAFAEEQGYVADMSDMGGLNGSRFHHEIYLSDVRKCRPENLKTVIRHPVRRA